MNIFEKINAMPRGCGIRDVSVGRLDGLTTDDLKSLVSVIEAAERDLRVIQDSTDTYCSIIAAKVLKTIRKAKGEDENDTTR